MYIDHLKGVKMLKISTVTLLALNTIIFSGCATQSVPPGQIPQTKETFDQYQSNLETQIIINSNAKTKFGKEPEEFIKIANEHFGKELLAYTKSYPYNSSEDVGGYMSCLIDKNKNLEAVFIKNEQVIDSTKLKQKTIEQKTSVCKLYKEYEEKKNSFFNAAYYNYKYKDKQYKEALPELLKDKSNHNLFGSEKNNKEAILSKLKYELFDFDSAKIELVNSSKSIIADKETFEPILGYAYFYKINAKNRMGAYTGYKTHYYFVKDGIIKKVID
jgi:hypothetical protein